jgi:signal transduction histidine kinase
MPNPNPKPSFFWRGLLILFPVLILAVVGMWALHQEWASVEHEANRRAESTATSICGEFRKSLQKVTLTQNGGAPLIEIPRDTPAFAVNEKGQLIFPESSAWPPVPVFQADESVAGMSAEKRDQWRQADAAFEQGDWTRVAELYFTFLNGKRRVEDETAQFGKGAATSDLRGLAMFRRGIAFEHLGRTNEAIVAYADSMNLGVGTGIFSESGLPLFHLAARKIMDLAHDQVAQFPEDWRQDPTLLVVRLKAETSPFSEELYHRLKALEPALKSGHGDAVTLAQDFDSWQHEQLARRLYSEAEEARAGGSTPWPATFWVDGESPWLAVYQGKATVTNGDKLYYAAFPESQLAATLNGLLAMRDTGDFAARTEVSGRAIGGKGAKKTDPSNPTVAFTAGTPDFPIAVTVVLADPAAYFAAHHRRQWLFSLLLIVAAATCAGAYVSAHRAFYRQLRLNEMKSNFVSSVSHELRAPIASVRLMAEGLERGTIQQPAKQHEYFRFIVQECRRLSSLIENVLDFSRIEQGRKQYELESTDLVALTEQTVKVMETYAAEQQIQITLAVKGEAVPVEIDGKAMQQALINLIDNAIKHSPKGATVKVGLDFGANRTSAPTSAATTLNNPNHPLTRPSDTLSPTGGEGRERGNRVPVETGYKTRPGIVQLWVEDNGEGIPAAEHEKIFERFYRIGSEMRRQTQGVGIGLSIVKHIVEAHGGKVIVRSAVGEGSRFTILLPDTNEHKRDEPSKA